MIQGKEGEIVIVSHNLDSNSIEILLRWKDSEIVGFTKISINNKIWRSQIKEQESSSLIEQNQTLRSLDDLKFFYPDNNDQNMFVFNLRGKEFKKEDIMLPPPKTGAKEVLNSLFNFLANFLSKISICCLKYLAYEDEQGNIQEYVLTAEENSRKIFFFETSSLSLSM